MYTILNGKGHLTECGLHGGAVFFFMYVRVIYWNQLLVYCFRAANTESIAHV